MGKRRTLVQRISDFEFMQRNRSGMNYVAEQFDLDLKQQDHFELAKKTIEQELAYSEEHRNYFSVIAVQQGLDLSKYRECTIVREVFLNSIVQN